MNDFIASNGVAVGTLRDGCLRIDINPEGTRIVIGDAITQLMPEVKDALREFFQAEADERLSRWRWPEDPEWLVKYIGDHTVIVVREVNFWENVGRQGQFNQFHYRDARNHGAQLSDKAARYKRAAWAFFEAHPDLAPKPWHDAQPGEVWEITRAGFTDKAWRLESGAFMYDDESWVFAKDIEAARRVFPEQPS